MRERSEEGRLRAETADYLEKMADELPAWKLTLGNELMRGIESVDGMESVLSQCQTSKEGSLIYLVYGLALLEKGKYKEAAPLLAAQDGISFEEVCLEFMRRGATDGLVLYLRAKIESLEESEKIQKAMLSSWLLEIQLSGIMGQDGLDYSYAASLPDDNDDPIVSRLKQKALVNKGLIEPPDDPSRIDFFSLKNKSVTERWRRIQSEKSGQFDVGLLLPALSYRYREIPNNYHDLREIIPILYDEDSDPALRRFALLLAAEMEDISLTETIHFRQDWLTPQDLNIALRVAYRRDDKPALVQLYSLFHMHEQAVQTSLAIDPAGTYAKQYLSSIDIEPKLGKQLSLLVAKRIIQHTSNFSSSSSPSPRTTGATSRGIPDASSILEDFPLLSIQDILPLFPNFVVIDSFKHEITNSLDEYNKNIDALKTEIDDYIKSLDSIQSEMRSVRSKEFFAPANATCALSGLPIAKANGPFCIFSSGLTYLDSVFKALQQRQHEPPHSADTTRKLLPSFYDECPLTGQIMIDSISQPLTLDLGDEHQLDFLPPSSWSTSTSSNNHHNTRADSTHVQMT